VVPKYNIWANRRGVPGGIYLQGRLGGTAISEPSDGRRSPARGCSIVRQTCRVGGGVGSGAGRLGAGAHAFADRFAFPDRRGAAWRNAGGIGSIADQLSLDSQDTLGTGWSDQCPAISRAINSVGRHWPAIAGSAFKARITTSRRLMCPRAAVGTCDDSAAVLMGKPVIVSPPRAGGGKSRRVVQAARRGAHGRRSRLVPHELKASIFFWWPEPVKLLPRCNTTMLY
jgi:hypothetical protein